MLLMRYLQNDRPKKKKKKKKDMAVIYRIGKHWYGGQLISVENSNKMSGENKKIWDLYGLTCGKRETLYKITLQTNVRVQSPRA